MPNITEFVNREKAPTPSSAGSEALEIEGRHTEAAFAQAGGALGRGMQVIGKDIQQHDELQDSSNISAQSAKAFADMGASLDTAMKSADPNKIDDAAEQWREKQYDTIDNLFSDNRTSQGDEMAARMRATLRQEATRSSMAYQSTIAGQAVVQNMDTTKSYLAQGVAANPSMLPSAMAIMQNGLDQQLKAHTFLSAEEVAKVREQYGVQGKKDLGIAAFKTMAESNPTDALKELHDPNGMLGGLFSGEELATLDRFAQTQDRINDAAAKSAATEQRRVEDQNFVNAQDKLITSMIGNDGSFHVTPGNWKDLSGLLAMPHTELGASRSLVDFFKSAAKGANGKSDLSTYAEFTDRVSKDTLTQNDILRANADGLLSQTDAVGFIKKLNADPAKKSAEKEFTAWANAQKPAFTKGNGVLGLSDPHGMAQWQQFEQAAHAQFEQAYDASKGSDAWRSTIQQGNKNYLGNLAQNYMPGKGNHNMTVNGTVVGGMRFNGYSQEDWKNPKMWSPVNQGQ